MGTHFNAHPYTYGDADDDTNSHTNTNANCNTDGYIHAYSDPNSHSHSDGYTNGHADSYNHPYFFRYATCYSHAAASSDPSTSPVISRSPSATRKTSIPMACRNLGSLPRRWRR